MRHYNVSSSYKRFPLFPNIHNMFKIYSEFYFSQCLILKTNQKVALKINETSGETCNKLQAHICY